MNEIFTSHVRDAGSAAGVHGMRPVRSGMEKTMEEQKNEDQLNPEDVAKAFKNHMATVETVLDQATADIAKMRDYLMKYGFTAQTETEVDEGYRDAMTKISQASAQIAVLYGLLAFCKAAADVTIPLHAMTSAYNAFVGSMVDCATGRLKVQ